MLQQTDIKVGWLQFGAHKDYRRVRFDVLCCFTLTSMHQQSFDVHSSEFVLDVAVSPLKIISSALAKHLLRSGNTLCALTTQNAVN